MSLQSLGDGWYRPGAGKKWRCAGPKYLCEAGNMPNFCHLSKTVATVRRSSGSDERTHRNTAACGDEGW